MVGEVIAAVGIGTTKAQRCAVCSAQRSMQVATSCLCSRLTDGECGFADEACLDVVKADHLDALQAARGARGQPCFEIAAVVHIKLLLHDALNGDLQRTVFSMEVSMSLQVIWHLPCRNIFRDMQLFPALEN